METEIESNWVRFEYKVGSRLRASVTFIQKSRLVYARVPLLLKMDPEVCIYQWKWKSRLSSTREPYFDTNLIEKLIKFEHGVLSLYAFLRWVHGLGHESMQFHSIKTSPKACILSQKKLESSAKMIDFERSTFVDRLRTSAPVPTPLSVLLRGFRICYCNLPYKRGWYAKRPIRHLILYRNRHSAW